MGRAWINGKFITSENKKSDKWKPAAEPDKKVWGSCRCGETIYEGDSVGMRSDHELVICYACWMLGDTPNVHLDCCGLKLNDLTLSY